MSTTIKIKDFSFDVYNLEKKAPCIIVLPGGGYFQLTENEGKPVAERLNQEGYSAIVLHYTINAVYPKPLTDFVDMMNYLEEHADELNIDLDHLIGMGFSAGGNLLGNYQYYASAHNIRKLNVLCFSYSMLDVTALHSDIEMLNGFYQKILTTMTDDQSKELLENLSPYYHVSDVPTFLWHVDDDPLIPSQQSIDYASKLKDLKVPYELHMFEEGGHGLSLADKTTAKKETEIKPEVAVWFDMCMNFIERHI